jgi:hypothetical protein
LPLSFSLVHPIHTFAPQKIALIYHSSLIGTGNRQDLNHICDLSSRSLFNSSFTDIAMLNIAKSIRAITGGRPPPPPQISDFGAVLATKTCESGGKAFPGRFQNGGGK